MGTGATANGQGGSGTGGSAGKATGGSSTAGAPSGMACESVQDCPKGGFACKNKVCACPADATDICGTGADAKCLSFKTDTKNCGECGKACDVGAACSAGKCGAKPVEIAVATGCGGGARMALQGSSLYWTESKTGKVRSMPVAGGTIADVATGQAVPTQLGVDDKSVYWVNFGDGTAGSEIVKKAMTAAAADKPVTLKKVSAMTKYPALAIHGDYVYYAETNNVHQIAKDEKVTTDAIVGISVNYDDKANPKIVGVPLGIAANDTRVVWATPGDRNAVESHTLTPITDYKDETGYAKLAKSVGALLETGDVAVDGTYGYWANGDKLDRNVTDSQDAIPKTVTSTPDVTATITAFAITSTNVYVASSDGTVFKHSLMPPTAPTDESTIVPPELIALGQGTITSVVVDGTKVYWINEDCAIRSTTL